MEQTQQLLKKDRLSVVGLPMPETLPVIFELLSNDNLDQSVYILGDNGEKYYVPLKEDRSIPTKSTIQNANGRTETIVYRSGIPTIFQDEQKKEFNIDPNARASYEDISALKFIQGELVCDDFTLLEYLWYSPMHNQYQGRRNGGTTPLYRVKDTKKKKLGDVKTNELRRIAMNKVAKISDVANGYKNFDFGYAFGILYKANGSHFLVDSDAEGVYGQLSEVVNKIVEKDDFENTLFTQLKRSDLLTSVDVIVGYAMKEGIISITHKVDEVSMISNNGTFETAYITGDNFSDFAEKLTVFQEYLQSPSGIGTLNILKSKVSFVDANFEENNAQDDAQNQEVEIKKIVEVPVEKIVEKIVNVEVEKIVNVEVSKKEDLQEIENLRKEIEKLKQKAK